MPPHTHILRWWLTNGTTRGTKISKKCSTNTQQPIDCHYLLAEVIVHAPMLPLQCNPIFNYEKSNGGKKQIIINSMKLYANVTQSSITRIKLRTCRMASEHPIFLFHAVETVMESIAFNSISQSVSTVSRAQWALPVQFGIRSQLTHAAGRKKQKKNRMPRINLLKGLNGCELELRKKDFRMFNVRGEMWAPATATAAGTYHQMQLKFDAIIIYSSVCSFVIYLSVYESHSSRT